MTARQRDELIIRIDERLANMDGTQKAMLEEARKTNGRVTKLEEWRTQQTTQETTERNNIGIGWKVIMAVTGLVAFIISLAVNIFF